MEDTIREEKYANFRCGKEFTTNDFLRQTLVNLSLDKFTPIDILTSEFSEITDSEQQLLLINADVKVDVTCQVGNDRVEEYWDKEKYKENGIEKERLVKKTRTVTDWAPLAFSRDENRTVVVLNQAEDIYFESNDEKYFDIVKRCKPENLTGTYMEYDNGAIARAKKLCMSKTVYEGIPSPKSKDVSASGSTQIKSLQGLIVPEYNLKYKYGGKEYTANGAACGFLDSDVHLCPHDEETIQKTARKKALPFIFGGLGCIVLMIVLAICQVPIVVGTLIGMCGGALLVAYPFVKKKFVAKIKDNRQHEKMNRLIATLSKRGLAPLDSIEESLFNKKSL